MSDLKIIKDGAVIIEGGIIKTVGMTKDISGNYDESSFDIIDASGKAVLPGFVDTHTHFVFGGYRPEEFSWRLRGDCYMEIMARGGILSTVEATRAVSKNELIAVGIKRLDFMLSFGVTTVEGKSGYGLDSLTEIKQMEVMEKLNKIHSIDIVRTYLGAHAVPLEYKGRADEYIDYMLDNVIPQVAQRGSG